MLSVEQKPSGIGEAKMANTTVKVRLPPSLTGLSDLILEFREQTGGGLINGEGDALTEPDAENDPGIYEATVTEEISGVKFGRVINEAGALFADGDTFLTDDEGVYILGEAGEQLPSAELIAALEALPGNLPPGISIILEVPES
jgi:hypothetical protein